MTRAAVLLVVLAACPHRDPPTKTVEPVVKKDAEPAATAAEAAVAVAPAPPLPDVPLGLPPVTLPAFVTPDAVARGAQLFTDTTMSIAPGRSCATCHDPAHGFTALLDDKTAAQAGAKRAAPIVDLAWKPDAATLPAVVHEHDAAMLGVIGDAKLDDPATATALAAYVLTRYAGDSPWDRAERAGHPPAEPADGYKLFMGKAQCAVCHTPPLYTDFRAHQLGDARHRIATPTLRDAALRPAWFRDGSAATLEDAIDKHAAETGAKPPKLSAAERGALVAFVRALSKAP